MKNNNLIRTLLCTIGLVISSSVTPVVASDFLSNDFYTLAQVYEQLDNMYAKYPDKITQKEQIGTTHEGRPIYVVKISDNPQNDEDEPEVFYNSLTHSNERMSMEVVIYYMYFLLENYETNPIAKYLVDNREMYFLPVVNPDGYAYNESTGATWRKNRRNNGDGSYGVDLNRNFGPEAYWNYNNAGSSTSPSNDTYRGTAPFSEPETQAIRDFLFNHNIKTALNYHTYSGQISFPYSAAQVPTADDALFKEWAEDMTRDSNYIIGKTIDTLTYAMRGDVLDYMYDGDIAGNHGKIYVFMPEVGFDTTFTPDPARIPEVVQENLYTSKYIALVAGSFVDTVTLATYDIPFNPGKNISATLKVKNKGLVDAPNTTAILSTTSPYINIKDGKEEIPALDNQENFEINNAFKFRVLENAPLNTRVDITVTISQDGLPVSSKTFTYYTGTESLKFFDEGNTLDNWTATNTQTEKWEITTDTYHSAPSSFTDTKTGNYRHQDKLNNALTSKTIDLTNMTSPRLAFWTKYAIYASLDYGRVQISTDNGTTWTNLTTLNMQEGLPYNRATGPLLTGTKTTWTRQEIDLTDYVGQQVKIRFLLTSVVQTEGTLPAAAHLRTRDGWYLDDIKVFEYFEKEKDSKSSDNSDNKENKDTESNEQPTENTIAYNPTTNKTVASEPVEVKNDNNNTATATPSTPLPTTIATEEETHQSPTTLFTKIKVFLLKLFRLLK